MKKFLFLSCSFLFLTQLLSFAQSPKIVGLIPVRNEQHLIGQCLKALSRYTDAMVVLDDASDDHTLEEVKAHAKEYNVERIIEKKQWYRDEPGDRNAMLQAGREIGGTHFIVMDADEMFTANCADNYFLRSRILELKSGDRLLLNWIQLWRSVSQYRFDNSVWTWNYKDFIFADDGACSYQSDFINTRRTPGNLSGANKKIEGYEYGVMHFQFVNWRNLLIKQAWYRCLEHIRNPQKPISEINTLYAPACDETNIHVEKAPNYWFNNYDFFNAEIFNTPEVWREKQILLWFQLHGKDFFADLDIWNIDWGGVPNASSTKKNACGTYDPLIVAVLMVKNEEPVIVETIKPLFEGGIDAFFIFDTGSEDKTIEKSQEFFDQHHVSRAYIAQEPFIDFATSRNRALELAKEKFPNAAFILMPDAEWHLINTSALLAFCAAYINSPSSYALRIISPGLDFCTQRLIRTKSNAHFIGVVHEYLATEKPCERVPPEIYFELRTTSGGYRKTEKRWQRDLDLLLREYQKRPYDERTAFYLAQTYECLDDFEHAYKYYALRTALHGWDEENFVAQYRFARVAEELAKRNIGEFEWEHARIQYEKASLMRPTRAEPLIKIAQHYLSEDNHELGFLYAQRAAQIPYPHQDILFVEKELYEYTRYDILGRCAWYVGQYAIGEAAIRLALNAHPDLPHLKSNLALYEKKRKG